MSAPLPEFTQTVGPEWIDYNGHFSEAYYVLVFGYATDAMMDATGLDHTYREATGCSLYTAESHVRYLREVKEGARLRIRTRVLGIGARKVHFAHEMYADDGELPVATIELLGVHVGADGAVAFPDEVRARYEALAEETPEWVGRAVRPVRRG